MQPLTTEAIRAVEDIAQRYGVSNDAAVSMLHAVSAGSGTMAQFNIAELGGSGQWMQGGMTMVGDMFNHGLQAKVAGICSELASLLHTHNVYAPTQSQQQFSGGSFSQGYASSWWPSDLGQPSSSGGQNDLRYAYFPQARRIAVDRGGRVTVYDSLDHQVGGVQQQQGGGGGTFSFNSQYGTFSVDSLPVVSGAPPQVTMAANAFSQTPTNQGSPPPSGSLDAERSQGELLTALERLGDLYQKGILTEAEFQTKKAELLGRL